MKSMARAAAAMVAAAALFGAGCQSGPQRSPLTLRVGTTASRPPICFRGSDGPVGLEIDFARDLAAALGRQVHFVTMAEGELLPALHARRIDIAMAGLAVAESPRLNVAFAHPYLRNGQMAAVRAGELGYNTDLRTTMMLIRSVGVAEGSTAEAYVRGSMVRSKVTTYRDLRQAVPALLNRNIDMVIADVPAMVQLGADNESSGLKALTPLLTEETLAWALNKDDVEMLAQVNAILGSWRRDGTLLARVGKWMPYQAKYNLAIESW